MYGGGFIGQGITVVKRTVEVIEGLTDTAPDHLVGKTGLVLDAHDDRYDTSNSETITLVVRGEDGEDFELPSYFCDPVCPAETDAKAT